MFRSLDMRVTNNVNVNLDNNYLCNQCDFKAKRKTRLNEHIESKHYGVRKDCSQCGKLFVSRTSLYNHIKSHHQDLTDYLCNHDQCNFKAKRKKKLRYHINSVHLGVNYPCNRCDFKAKRPDTLKEHIESKHDRIKHECSQCGKQFSRGYLYQHIKSQHEGFEDLKVTDESCVKYSCKKCGYEAMDEETVVNHILRH